MSASDRECVCVSVCELACVRACERACASVRARVPVLWCVCLIVCVCVFVCVQEISSHMKTQTRDGRHSFLGNTQPSKNGKKTTFFLPNRTGCYQIFCRRSFKALLFP